ncbi:glycosyltransferase family 2 protein [Paracoccus siganidrum]|uniref:Glycosyltransferase n=1 Tax=Paracoccus siganidrum TaxID=1276757 RepID=A0A419AA99_9RHOB|nr:glycosyltransferase [Paracoccus siganidrum]RJL19684.1 glycosyltransferase [Paracoccus siganidrum]RMC35933.1 hypothetical protein C9E82_10650 [Paracoccus siganidrum]
MAISFIVTIRDVAPTITDCLADLAAVARARDEVILVDDGSQDGTVDAATACLADPGFAEGVAVNPIWLGTRTPGGIGIRANVGLSAASRETVVFVDGDGRIQHDGFQRARAHWVMHPADILLTGYQELDPSGAATRPAAEARCWNQLDRAASLARLRDQALAFAAAPWRVFHRRTFLERHGLRFSETDAPLAEVPFHWATCLAADSIGFLDTVTCHRPVPPEDSLDPAAVFTRFAAILELLPADELALQETAACWLLDRMEAQAGHLPATGLHAYATAGATALAAIADPVWARLAARHGDRPIWTEALRLRAGDIWGQLDAWDRAALDRRIARIEARAEGSERTLERAGRDLRALAASRAFAAIQQLERG